MKAAIQIHHLSKIYRDFHLDNISFTLPSGAILGLIGENGAGKSTIIKLILNLIKKDSGEIKLFDADHTVCSMEDLGVVFDEHCFPETLSANEMNAIFKSLYSRWDENTYKTYLKKFSLPENKSIKTFSKGMKMKLSIAAALSHNAKLLILDEATSGLDPVVRDEILDIFYDFTRDEGHSILISSHIVSDLEKLCDYIAFVHNGRLILFDEKDEILNNYCIVECSRDDFNKIDKKDILGVRKNPYATSAVIKKSAVNSSMVTTPIDLENLFVYMVRGIQK